MNPHWITMYFCCLGYVRFVHNMPPQEMICGYTDIKYL